MGGVVTRYETKHATRQGGRHRAGYVDALMSELERLIEGDPGVPSDLEERLGPPDEVAQRIYDLLPRRSPWADVVGPVYRTGQVEELLGCSRQAVADRVKRRTLLALQTRDRQLVYPAFQFTGNRVVDGLSAVLKVVGDSVDDWTLASWLRAPQPSLGTDVITTLARSGATPEVISVTRAAAERWSR